MTKQKPNIALKIGSLIPGFNAYSDRYDRRNREKIFRVENVKMLERSEQKIIDFQKTLTTDNISLLNEWEQVRKPLNTMITKIKNATYGESSFFSAEQIKEDELNEILQFDEEIVVRIQLIFKATENEINDRLTPANMLNNLKQIDEILLNRSNFISRYK
jgi:hypothetical protein